MCNYYDYDNYDSYDYYDRQTGLPFGLPFGGQQGMPPFGLPFQQPGFQPPAPPFGAPGGGQQQGPPSGPPPSFVPQQTQAQTPGVGVFAIDPGAIRPCRFRFVYLWLRNGQQFWAWLVFVGNRSAAGWRWTGFRWVYFGVDLEDIQSFVCY
ncbi:MAG TPA: hypothetical protein GXX36_02035 [Clostridiaceae bacterium]|nr:hypothetical protein [Clostridiaceae bacterium]